jgi:hypothetical protein
MILIAISVLNNYCATKVGLNQIQAVYAPHLLQDPISLYFE